MNRREMLIGGGALAAVAGSAVYLAASDMGNSSEYAKGIAPSRAPLADPAISRDLIRYATLAPNGHNTQPWMFRVRDRRIDILPDFSRRTPIVDPDDHHLFVSLGAAAENLSLASAARGRPGTPRFDPANGGSIVFISEAGQATPSALFDAIPRRQSTRAEYDGRAVSPADLNRLVEAATMPGVSLILLTDLPRIERMRDFVVAGNSAQMADPAFVRELKSWLRFNPRQALRNGDGLYSVTTGNPMLPDWLGPFAFDWLATTHSQNDAYARQIRSSSGIAVFLAEQADSAHWVAVGQACQRFALQATALGLKHAFINQPVEVARLRPELAALMGMPGRRPDIVMRFGHGAPLPYSPRRPVASVMTS
ncbi:nitroreductase family protein [Sphingomonas sp.]|uniref:Acg family FMN-binding oxidoreductase n=1 Tax=Sphingomonas sp. TaxID=28214 RepID=UPI0025DEBC4B|nr:nitroreductase family protein [Sphingomonas sp.]